jgi:hypothetical protein
MNERFRSYADIVEEKIEDAKKSVEELRPEEQIEPIFVKPDGNLLVKILTDVPKFVGSNLENYGPLKAGDIITLPEEISKLLISRKAAENILE